MNAAALQLRCRWCLATWVVDPAQDATMLAVDHSRTHHPDATDDEVGHMFEEVSDDQALLRCAACGEVRALAEWARVAPSYGGCPCGDPGVPHPVADDVTITLNWRELAAIYAYAEMWATHQPDPATREAMRRRVLASAASLEAQHPDRKALTIATTMERIQQAQREARPATDTNDKVVRFARRK